MTQHQMDSGEVPRDEPHASYTGYEGTPPYESYSSSLGQKLSADFRSSSFSPGQRLALAIISLVLWVVVLVIVVASMSSVSPDNPSSRVLYPLLIAALLIWLVGYLLPNAGNVAMGVYTVQLALILTAVGLVEIVVATLAGAFIYKE